VENGRPLLRSTSTHRGPPRTWSADYRTERFAATRSKSDSYLSNDEICRTGDPLIYANTVWFRLAWHLAAERDSLYDYPPRLEALRARHGSDRAAGLDVGDLTPDDRASDGIVPSASQAYGTILGVFASDHLDCIGHFSHRLGNGTEVSGWVRSGASFRQERFELLWGRVAAFVAASIGRELADATSASTRLAS
jgi:hypothetical protein